MSDTYCGIDLSLSATGYSFWGPEGGIADTIKSRLKNGARLHEIADRLVSLIKKNHPKIIAIEGYSYGSPFGVIPGAELGGTVKAYFWAAGIENVIYVAPSSLKKFVTGSGKAKKGGVQMHVLSKWGVQIEDDNAADAYGLARVAAGYYDSRFAPHAYEREVCEGLRKKGDNR